MKQIPQNVNHLPLPQAAIAYANAGWRVFPVEPSGKRPLVRWSEEATTDAAQVFDWWLQYPTANIGLPMGDGVHALDMDEKGNEHGWFSYTMAGGDKDPAQPVQKTPGGGRHLLFADERDFKNFTHQGAYGGLDMRSARGYILGAPSVIGGKAYEWGPGDLQAELPWALLAEIDRWSGPAPKPARLGDFPVPEPAQLETFEVQAMIANLDAIDPRCWLEPIHSNALLRGDPGPTGDLSRQMYRTLYLAFRRAGWTLEDIARIGPETFLATFGAEPPHSARDPWLWAWRYTVRSAWEDAQADLERYRFEALPGVAGGATAAREADWLDIPGWLDVPVQAKESPQPCEGHGEEVAGTKDDEIAGAVYQQKDPGVATHAAAMRVNILESLHDKARTLQRHDYQGMQDLVLEAKRLGLSAGQQEILWHAVQEYTGYSRGTIRQLAKDIEQSVREEKRKEKQVSAVPTEIYVRDQGKFFDTLSGSLLNRDAVLILKAREFNGDIVKATEHYLSGERAVCEQVESLTYDPGMGSGIGLDPRGVRVFNLYRPTDLAPRAGSVKPWLDLLRAMRLEGGKQDEDALLDWCAFLVQRPGEKVNHGVVMGGKHGIGKDSWWEPIIRAVGRHNTNHIHGGELASDFNAWQAQAKLVVLNELDFGSRADRRKVSEALKPALAAPPLTLRVNEKHVKPYSIPNLLQCVGFSNHRGALSLDPGERRYLALWCEEQIPEDPRNPQRQAWDNWFRDYWAWLDSGGAEAVYAFLMSRDLAKFNPGARPRVTPWLEEMMSLGSDPLVNWMREAMAAKRGVFALEAADLDTIGYEAIQGASVWLGGRKPTEMEVQRAIIQAGGQKIKTEWMLLYAKPGTLIGSEKKKLFEPIHKYRRKLGLPAVQLGHHKSFR